MPQIYNMGPTALLPLWRKACWEFFRPKNQTASAGFEHANLGTKGQHATPRPPKPQYLYYLIKIKHQLGWTIIKMLNKFWEGDLEVQWLHKFNSFFNLFWYCWKQGLNQNLNSYPPQNQMFATIWPLMCHNILVELRHLTNIYQRWKTSCRTLIYL